MLKRKEAKEEVPPQFKEPEKMLLPTKGTVTQERIESVTHEVRPAGPVRRFIGWCRREPGPAAVGVGVGGAIGSLAVEEFGKAIMNSYMLGVLQAGGSNAVLQALMGTLQGTSGLPPLVQAGAVLYVLGDLGVWVGAGLAIIGTAAWAINELWKRAVEPFLRREA